jgi:hypothetical protein
MTENSIRDAAVERLNCRLWAGEKTAHRIGRGQNHYDPGSMAMTQAELEAERLALLAEEHELQEAHQRLHLTPNDRPAHAAHRERLKAHAARARAFRDAIQQRPVEQLELPVRPPLQETARLPTVCPVCHSPSITPSRRNSYRCLGCGAIWIMGHRLVSEE